MLYGAAKAVLFRLGGGDAETAHEWTLARLAWAARQPRVLATLARRYAVEAPREVFGLRFPNPIGLAAGMDKNGVALPAWPALGFGFVEVGTVTWHPQPGNPRPRMFRLRGSDAVINRMGFNNAGARALADVLDALGPLRMPPGGQRGAGDRVPLGISLGKSKVTDLGQATEDYLASLRVLHRHGDYFAVNVSSPNTPGLRSLQDRSHLDELLGALVKECSDKPVLVKLAPDLSDAAIVEALGVCLDRGVAGVIATNTTLSRAGVSGGDLLKAEQAGGLSGRPLRERARAVVSLIHRESSGRLPVIGVGGIVEPDDAARLLDAGASLVQLYTGLIYAGPELVRRAALAVREG